MFYLLSAVIYSFIGWGKTFIKLTKDEQVNQLPYQAKKDFFDPCNHSDYCLRMLSDNHKWGKMFRCIIKSTAHYKTNIPEIMDEMVTAMGEFGNGRCMKRLPCPCSNLAPYDVSNVKILLEPRAPADLAALILAQNDITHNHIRHIFEQITESRYNTSIGIRLLFIMFFYIRGAEGALIYAMEDMECAWYSYYCRVTNGFETCYRFFIRPQCNDPIVKFLNASAFDFLNKFLRSGSAYAHAVKVSSKWPSTAIFQEWVNKKQENSLSRAYQSPDLKRGAMIIKLLCFFTRILNRQQEACYLADCTNSGSLYLKFE